MMSLGSLILIVSIFSIPFVFFIIPVYGQADWYDDWVGTDSKNYEQRITNGFSVDEFVTGLAFPTTMSFVNDDILVLQKNNGFVLFVDKNGKLLPDPLLDLNVANMYENEISTKEAMRNDFFAETDWISYLLGATAVLLVLGLLALWTRVYWKLAPLLISVN